MGKYDWIQDHDLKVLDRKRLVHFVAESFVEFGMAKYDQRKELALNGFIGIYKLTEKELLGYLSEQEKDVLIATGVLGL